MAYQSLDQFMRELPEKAAGAESTLRGHSGRYRLITRQGRTVNIDLCDGHLTFPGEMADPDTVVTADESILLQMLNGTLHPAKALLMGKVQIRGSKTKLLELARLI